MSEFSDKNTIHLWRRGFCDSIADDVYFIFGIQILR